MMFQEVFRSWTSALSTSASTPPCRRMSRRSSSPVSRETMTAGIRPQQIEAYGTGEGPHPFCMTGPDEPGGAGEDRAVVLLDAVDPAVRSRGIGAGDEGDVAGELAAAGLEIFRGAVPEIDDAPAHPARGRHRHRQRFQVALAAATSSTGGRLPASSRCTRRARCGRRRDRTPAACPRGSGPPPPRPGCRRNSCRSRRRGSRGWSGSPARRRSRRRGTRRRKPHPSCSSGPPAFLVEYWFVVGAVRP